MARRKPKIWSHPKKYKGQKFEGHYFNRGKDRGFLLRRVGGVREITFESHEHAKAGGWVAN